MLRRRSLDFHFYILFQRFSILGFKHFLFQVGAASLLTYGASRICCFDSGARSSVRPTLQISSVKSPAPSWVFPSLSSVCAFTVCATRRVSMHSSQLASVLSQQLTTYGSTAWTYLLFSQLVDSCSCGWTVIWARLFFCIALAEKEQSYQLGLCTAYKDS